MDAAFGHAHQRGQGGVAGGPIAPPIGAGATQQESQVAGVWKLGCATEAAMAHVETAQQEIAAAPDRPGIEPVESIQTRRAGVAGTTRHRAGQHLAQRAALLGDIGRPLLVQPGDAPADLGECRQAMARGIGKVRAAEKGHVVAGTQEHGERPAAAAAGEHLVRRLVDLVEVRALLAIDLDVDEQLVHHRRDFGILERLVRHDVAPVAGRVADREQDRPVLLPRQSKRVLTPGMPIDGIVRVLKQVGRSLARESIGHWFSPA